MASHISVIDSKVITDLRLPLAFLVVLLHSVGYGLPTGHMMIYQNGVFDTIKILFSEGICVISVPIFFVISGFLFEAHFEKWNMSEYRKYIRSKFPKIALPYILWNALCLTLIYITSLSKGGVNDAFWEYFNHTGGLNIFAFANKGFPIDYPLWFVRDLFIIYLLYPILRWIYKMGGGKILLIPAGLSVSCILLNCFEYISTQAVLFFMVGIHCKRRKNTLNIIPKDNNAWRYILGFITITLLIAMILLYNNNTKAYHIVRLVYILCFAPLFVHWFYCKTKREHVSTGLSINKAACSFFVFASHAIILKYVVAVINRFCVTEIQLFLTGVYFTVAVSTFLIAVLLFILIETLFPKTCLLLTGGR